MKIFKFKYLIASLVIHSTVVSFFLLFDSSVQKADTTMLVTEIIKIEEKSRFNDVKKTKNSMIKKNKNVNTNKKLKKENIPVKIVLKPDNFPVKFESKKQDSQKQTDDVKKTIIKDKSTKEIESFNKKNNAIKFEKNKDLSKANYKIGSINNPHPPYPIIARKKGIEGKLILKVSVNNDGSVKHVSIRKSSGYQILDKVSKETIEKWVFIPAQRMGKNVEDFVQVPIKFVLTD